MTPLCSAFQKQSSPVQTVCGRRMPHCLCYRGYWQQGKTAAEAAASTKACPYCPDDWPSWTEDGKIKRARKRKKVRRIEPPIPDLSTARAARYAPARFEKGPLVRKSIAAAVRIKGFKALTPPKRARTTSLDFQRIKSSFVPSY